MRVDATIALLETAIHPTTNEMERTNAINLFRQMTDRSGGLKSFLKVAGGGVLPPTPYVPYSAQRAEIEKLHGDIRERDDRIASLEREVGQLRKENGQYRERQSERARGKPNPDGSMSYADWFKEAKRRIGAHGDRIWQTAFETQTGLSKSRIQKFRQNNIVDDLDYINALDKLKPVDPPLRYEKEWTRDEVERVRYYTDSKKMSERQVAALLSAEFGRNITEGMIKRVKDNSRKGVGVFRDPAYGGPIGKKRTLHV